MKPLITNTSEEFIKCRLDNFSMSLLCKYINSNEYNHLIKKTKYLNIPLSESEEYDI